MKHKLFLASICLIMGAGGLSAQEAGQEQTPTVYSGGGCAFGHSVELGCPYNH